MKSVRMCIIMFLYLVCLAGCAQETLPVETETSEEVSGQKTPEEESLETLAIDWKTAGFAVSEDIIDEQGFWPSEYIRWQHEAISYDSSEEVLYNVRELGASEGRIYRLCDIRGKGEQALQRYVLEIYDTSAMQDSAFGLNQERLGVGDGFIAGMDVLGEDEFAVFLQEYTRDEAGEFSLQNSNIVFTDLKDRTEKVDVLSVFQEKSIQDKMYQEYYCDASGNGFVRGAYRDSPARFLYVIDRGGSLLAEQSVEEYDEIRPPFQMQEGGLVFPVNNRAEKTARLLCFDSEEEKMQVLATLEEESIAQVYGMQGNDLYYESYEHNGIVRWNVVSGDRALVFSFDENAVSRIYNTMLIFRKGQPPIFRMYGEVNGTQEDWLVILSEEETVNQETTRVTSLNGDSVGVKDCVAMSSRKNPDLSFKYEACAETDSDEFRNRIFAELVAGGGPDILYVSLEDMKRLQEMGVLAELDVFLPSEAKERILPGVIELGTVDGMFTGIAPDVDVSTIVTLKGIWEKNTWSLEDVTGLLDTGDFTGIFCQGTTSFAPQALLRWLTTFGLQESVLIDWEKRESHFDSELFLKILEISEAYGDDPVRMDTWLGVGGCPGMITGANIEVLNELYERYGEEYFFVGMPTRGNSGNYLSSRGVLVVNKETEDTRAVSAFLECLLEEEIQYPNRVIKSTSILKVSPNDLTTVEAENETKAFWKDYRVQIKEDGSTTLDDYKNLLESCVPHPEEYNDILSIVWEEGQSYIAGDKSAAEAAKIIDSRVQAYLDEGGG